MDTATTLVVTFVVSLVLAYLVAGFFYLLAVDLSGDVPGACAYVHSVDRLIALFKRIYQKNNPYSQPNKKSETSNTKGRKQ